MKEHLLNYSFREKETKNKNQQNTKAKPLGLLTLSLAAFRPKLPERGSFAADATRLLVWKLGKSGVSLQTWWTWQTELFWRILLLICKTKFDRDLPTGSLVVPDSTRTWFYQWKPQDATDPSAFESISAPCHGNWKGLLDEWSCIDFGPA